jgi:O-antigen ligase
MQNVTMQNTMQNKEMKSRDRSSWKARVGDMASRARRPFVFGALLAFSALYYYRPEDFIPGLSYIPMAKVAAILGVVALVVGMTGGGKAKIPRAIKILWLLLLQLVICIPFAIWPGGALAMVLDNFSKAVIVATLISMAVVTVWELRKLLWIQVTAVALVTIFSIALRHHDLVGRLSGVQKGILENPNDLAINIAISFPLGLAFLLHARGFKKTVWGVALAFMSLGIILTYSRSGLLAFLISVMICVWEYGIKGKRQYLVVAAGVILLLGMAVALSSAHYRARVESIFMGNVEGSGDRGSLEARKNLLKKSISVALHHPLFGVGPGCFKLVDQGWIVAHNSYTELAAEDGFLALALFLMAMWAAFKNLAQVRRSQKYSDDPEFRLFTQALWAGLATYLVAAGFGSTEYNLYPYFMVAYTCAMVRIASQPSAADGPGGNGQGKNQTLSKRPFARIPGPQPVLSR